MKRPPRAYRKKHPVSWSTDGMPQVRLVPTGTDQLHELRFCRGRFEATAYLSPDQTLDLVHQLIGAVIGGRLAEVAR